MQNNPLIYVDPSGHAPQGTGGTFYTNMKIAAHCANVGLGVCMKEAKAGTIYFSMEVVNFLFLDDINTILDPEASTFDKTLAAVGFIPIGKLYKGGKLIIKLSSDQGRTIERAVELNTDNINAAHLIPCNCFTAGTKVITDEGEKNIEDIEVGDKVLSKNEETGEQTYKEVTALHRNEKDTTYKLTVGDQIIETTDNHPFWVEGKGWVLAVDLKVGDELVQSNGNHLKIDNIEIVHHDEKVKVYNFTVADFHTYFVSSLGIWVHNIKNFCGSAADLAELARNSKKIDGLQGVKVSADLIYDAAIDFVGKGAKVQKINGGMWYVSKDGLRRVRTGQKSKGAYEANFETLDKNGKVLTNYHVEIE